MFQVVFLKIAMMFLVIVAGWFARRRGLLSAELSSAMSMGVVDAAFPALVFTQILRTVNPGSLAQDAFAPVYCGLLIGIAYVAGVATAPWFCSEKEKRTYVFLVTIPNWVFLPLPIAQALYGDSGVRTVLLCNVGAQMLLWSFGVWILHGSMKEAVKQLTSNVGLWATAAGILLGLMFPAARELEGMDPARASGLKLFFGACVQAVAMVGSLTIPLSLLAIGAQLGGLTGRVPRLTRTLAGVVTARLLVGPLLTVAVIATLARLGLGLPEEMRMVLYLIAAMPVAISCSVMAERFAGETALAAAGIFYSTFFSLVTVPLVFLVVRRFGL